MPRRYRPPTRRRKTKKQRLAETEAPFYEDAVAPAPTPPPLAAPAAEERPAQVRHIAGDFSYVLTELRLIGLLVAFIIGGLIITAVLR